LKKVLILNPNIKITIHENPIRQLKVSPSIPNIFLVSLINKLITPRIAPMAVCRAFL